MVQQQQQHDRLLHAVISDNACCRPMPPSMINTMLHRHGCSAAAPCISSYKEVPCAGLHLQALVLPVATPLCLQHARPCRQGGVGLSRI
jgi:hypothetical protein